ncbi:MAG TPA: DMT family transporter [Candidatus Acidoferrum sp.]|nr:DMT family transporter [Candidatus Acidoferrum sp.]
MTDLTLGILAGLGCGLNWAVTSLLARSLLGRLSPAGLSAVRSTVGGGILIVAAIAAGEGPAMLQAPFWVVLSLWTAIVLSMGVGDSIFFRSLDYLSLTLALDLSLLNPLLTTLTGIAIYGEPITLLRLAGIAAVLGGLGLVISGRGQEGPRATRAGRRGLRLVVFASMAWALSATILKPALLHLPILAGTALRIPMAGLVLWLTPWTRGTLDGVRASTRNERWQLATVCLLNAVGSALFTIAIRSGGVAIGNTLASTSPLFAIPLEIGLLKTCPSKRTIVGVVCTVGGIACLAL